MRITKGQHIYQQQITEPSCVMLSGLCGHCGVCQLAVSRIESEKESAAGIGVSILTKMSIETVSIYIFDNIILCAFFVIYIVTSICPQLIICLFFVQHASYTIDHLFPNAFLKKCI